MKPTQSPKLDSFRSLVQEADNLHAELSTLDTAIRHRDAIKEQISNCGDEAEARKLLGELMRIIANPGKGDNVAEMKKLLGRLGDSRILRNRHAASKLRFQLHITNGLSIKKACLEAVSELLLDAVGGKESLAPSLT